MWCRRLCCGCCSCKLLLATAADPLALPHAACRLGVAMLGGQQPPRCVDSCGSTSC
jgi:hypothetical protein